MKIKLVSDDGSIEGWVIALGETIIVYGFWVVGLFVPKVQAGWRELGPFMQVIFPLTLGSWFGYKAVSKFAS